MIKLENITKKYAGEQLPALANISLDVSPSEFVAIVGPSGSGKSTLLKLCAGLLKPTEGAIGYVGKSFSGTSKERGVVFQHYSLFPWLTVADNIMFGGKVHSMQIEMLQKRCAEYLQATGLAAQSEKLPHQLSGGMQQRVAIARTLVNNPSLILLDEPFGALDTQTRAGMQDFLATLWEKEKKTVILVTHDVEEALFLADRVIVLSKKPATIKKEFCVPFARPRHHELRFTPEFVELRKQVSESIDVTI